MEFSEDLLKSIQEGDLIKIRAELIGCLDDDEISSEPPCTLKMAELLSEKLGDKLFEADNGHCDFNAPLTDDTLMSVKSRLTMNFSKEKLEFACNIIQALKANISPAKPAEQVPTKPAEQVPTKPAEQVPAKPAEQVQAKPAEQGPVKPAEQVPTKPAEQVPVKPIVNATTKPVPMGTHGNVMADTSAMSKNQQHISGVKEAEWPTNMPNAMKPSSSMNNLAPKSSSPSATEPRVSSQSVDTSQKGYEQTRVLPQNPTVNHGQNGNTNGPRIPIDQASSRTKPRVRYRSIGFWERTFGAIGRRMDEFFKILLGK